MTRLMVSEGDTRWGEVAIVIGMAFSCIGVRS